MSLQPSLTSPHPSSPTSKRRVLWIQTSQVPNAKMNNEELTIFYNHQMGNGWGPRKPEHTNKTQTKLWKRFELYFTCKRSSDLAEPEGPATSTTSLACSATCCKGATKGVVHLELGNTLCSMEATDSWPRTHSPTSIIILPLLLFLFFFTPTIQTTQRAIRKKQGRTPNTHTQTHVQYCEMHASSQQHSEDLGFRV
jgi:hypothetical protein